MLSVLLKLKKISVDIKLKKYIYYNVKLKIFNNSFINRWLEKIILIIYL